jgi:DNA sulfur modification protein DndB
MNKIALREYSGDWIYYITAFTYEEVEKYVKKVDNELHKSNMLSEMIQRCLTNNVGKIANYIQQQREHFFNALVLAVYDGDPQWREIRIDYGDGEVYKELGVLEFNGDEKIFPVDGQHRVEGIKTALKTVNRDTLLKETIPVILIGHKNTEEGRRRTRRLFSTLNRYAKPVTLNDIISLDEDDSIAIATRHLIETNILFQDGRLNNHKQKAIPENDKSAFTNIISLYECNTILLNDYLKDFEIKSDGKNLKGKRKIEEYCRFRRSDKEIDGYIAFVDSFWDSFIANMDCIKNYLRTDVTENPAAQFRNKQGGSLLFRPVGQRPFVITAIELYDSLKDFDKVFSKMNCVNLDITNDLWQYIVWNPISKKMITSSNAKIIEYILKYIVGVELSQKEISELLILFKSFKNNNEISDDEIKDYLSTYRV